jgi:hypothetical protein
MPDIMLVLMLNALPPVYVPSSSSVFVPLPPDI